jgi:glycine/D-amino acid oxidase-like deaminating enzyme
MLITGKSVAVLEARVIGAGQTGRTTAHLMPWNDDYYALQVHHASAHTSKACLSVLTVTMPIGMTNNNSVRIDCRADDAVLALSGQHLGLLQSRHHAPCVLMQKLQLGEEKLKILGESHKCAGA